MKKISGLILIVVLIGNNSVSYSQKLSAGFFSGVNFSDIHGNEPYGKWKFKPGPSEGIFVDYSFSKLFGIKTGLNYSALRYENLSYTQPYCYNIYPASSSSYYPGPGLIYYPVNETMDFSYMTVPLQLRFTIPSKPGVNLSAGMFYSFLQDHSLNNYYYYYPAHPVKHDFGYIYSAGISYPLSGVFTGSFNAGYMTGRKEFIENSNLRNGSMDFTFAIAYNGFFKKLGDRNRDVKKDSISDRVDIIYKGGINLSWNAADYFKDKYSVSTGPSLGFAVNILLAPKVTFQTGLSYERTGYSLRDSSVSFYRYSMIGSPVYNVNTKISLDYIVIPALLNFYIGKSNCVYINSGPYLGIRLNAQVTGKAYAKFAGENIYQVTKTVVYDDLGGVIKDNDFGWIFGGGLNVPLSSKITVDIGVQYRIGFTDIFNKSRFPLDLRRETAESVIRNGAVAFQLGIKVPVFQ